MSTDETTHGPSAWLHEDHIALPEPTRDDVERRRRVLYDAMRDLEVAISRPSSSPGWSQNLLEILTPLLEALESHVAEVEGAGGLFEEVLMREPRMAHAIDMLKDGHSGLRAACSAAIESVDSDDKDLVRDRVNEVLFRLARHRQKGSELIYETYAVDIATGD